MKQSIIETLRDELEAALIQQRTEANPIVKAEITGYIRALQVAIIVVNKAKA